jgi:Protein of unknown function (DUF4239)
MSSLGIFCVVFACIFAAALVAMFVKRVLPENHLSADSKDVVKLGMGLIATLAALVLGLLIATAKGSYDTQGSAVKEYAANVILLDRILRQYGPETKEARELLRAASQATLARLWPDGGTGSANLAPDATKTPLESLYESVAQLEPKTDSQRGLKARALDVIVDQGRARIRMFAQQDSSLPLPFLVVLVFWLIILFAGYGLLAPPNATVIAVLLVCTLSVSGAIFLMLELATPFAGIMRVSSGPLRDAINLLGQ